MTAKVGPSLELQTAILAIWSADADVQSLLGDKPRFYQEVPSSPKFPYVTPGEAQTLPDLAECIDGREIYPAFHIWSRSKGFTEAKSIAATLWAAIADVDPATLALTENKCLILDFESQNDLRDPDGTTFHVVLTLRALMEPAA